MSSIIDQVMPIQGRMETIEKKIKSLLTSNQAKIEENNKVIADLSSQIEQILAEINNCQIEIEKVTSDYDKTVSNLEKARPKSSEYDLLDNDVLTKLIQAAEDKKNQILSQIDSTLESLNKSLGEFRIDINERGIENDALSDLSSLVNEKHSQLLRYFEETMSNVDSQLKPLEEALKDSDIYILKDEEPVKELEPEETPPEEKNELEPEVNKEPDSSNLIDLEQYFSPKEKNDELTEPLISEEDMGLDSEKGATITDLSDLLEPKPITEQESKAEVVSEMNVEETPPAIQEEIVVQEETPPVVQDEIVVQEETPPAIQEEIVVQEETPPVVQEEAPLHTEEPSSNQKTLQEKLNEPEETLTYNEADYTGINKLGLTDDQKKYLMTNMDSTKYSQMINILHNYGINIEDIGPFYQYLAHIEDPKITNEVFTLLRGIGKNNEAEDFSSSLEYIFESHPETLQENLLELYSQGKDPQSVHIQLLCSIYFENLKLLEEDGFDVQLLVNRFPVMIAILPYIQFKSFLASQNVVSPQKTMGGKAA